MHLGTPAHRGRSKGARKGGEGSIWPHMDIMNSLCSCSSAICRKIYRSYRRDSFADVVGDLSTPCSPTSSRSRSGVRKAREQETSIMAIHGHTYPLVPIQSPNQDTGPLDLNDVRKFAIVPQFLGRIATPPRRLYPTRLQDSTARSSRANSFSAWGPYIRRLALPVCQWTRTHCTKSRLLHEDLVGMHSCISPTFRKGMVRITRYKETARRVRLARLLSHRRRCADAGDIGAWV